MYQPRVQEMPSDKQNQLYRKWDAWLEEIKNELVELHASRRTFWDLGDVINQNPRLKQRGNHFLDWMAKNYLYSMVTSIRRLVDNRRSTMSYRRLLEDIHRNPTVLSRSRFKANFVCGDWDEHEADTCFDQLVGVGREHIDREFVQGQIDELVSKTKALTTFANRRITHHEDIEVTEIPKVGDAHTALDYLESIMKYYWNLFRCEDFLRAEPYLQYNWKEIFYFPWIEGEAFKDEKVGATTVFLEDRTSRER